MDVQILLYDGFDELDGIGPYEVFDYAGEYSDGAVSVSFVTREDRDQVTASHGTRIEPDGTLADPSTGTDEVEPDGVDSDDSGTKGVGSDESGSDDVGSDRAGDDLPDLLVVPGGGWTTRDGTASAWAEAQKGDIPAALANYHDAEIRIASVCTGAMLLAEAGVTHGRRAVTHASATDELRESGANVVDARVVDDGDLISAGGVTSGIDLALYLVEQEVGADVADRIGTVIEYDRQHDVAES